MQKNLLAFTVLLLAATLQLRAQVGIGTLTPAASSALDVTSTTKGVLIPRMTGTQRTAIVSPAEGLMVYQTNAPIGLWMFINGAWVRLASTNDILSTSASFAGNTSGSVIAVILGGTNIPLPDANSLGTGITINGSNDVLTVANAGRYRIAFSINTTAALLAGARVTINGTPNTALSIAPVVSTSHLAAEAVVTLTAGSTVSLQMYGLIGAAVLLGSSQGAGLTIQRVE